MTSLKSASAACGFFVFRKCGWKFVFTRQNRALSAAKQKNTFKEMVVSSIFRKMVCRVWHE